MISKEDYYCQVEEEVLEEFLANDRIYQAVTLHSFVSKSKGRNRKRRNWKEVNLIKYNNGFHLEKNFPFDECATEILGDIEDAEAKLREAVLGCQTYNLNDNYGTPV